jgi:hypothetical protein
MKSRTNCKNPLSNPLGSSRKLVPAFRKPPVTRKDVPKAGHELNNNEREGKTEQKFDAAFGSIFRIRNVFKEASRNWAQMAHASLDAI